jgi:hypothetical protein
MQQIATVSEKKILKVFIFCIDLQSASIRLYFYVFTNLEKM